MRSLAGTTSRAGPGPDAAWVPIRKKKEAGGLGLRVESAREFQVQVQQVAALPLPVRRDSKSPTQRTSWHLPHGTGIHGTYQNHASGTGRRSVLKEAWALARRPASHILQ